MRSLHFTALYFFTLSQSPISRAESDAVLTCPEVVFRDGFAIHGDPAPFFNSPNVAKLLRPNGSLFELGKFLALRSLANVKTRLGIVPTVQLELSYDGQYVGRCRYQFKNSTLRFDIRLSEQFRGQGFYEAMLAHALADYPSVDAVPSRMLAKQSSSARQIFKSAYGSALSRPRLMIEMMDEAQVKSIRKKIINAVGESSISRARAANGFGRLTRIIIEPEGNGVGLFYEKGEKLGSDEIKVFVQGVESVALLSSGKWAFVKDESELRLGDYIEAMYLDTTEMLN